MRVERKVRRNRRHRHAVLMAAVLAGAQSSIENARLAAGITRAELARRMGVARPFVTRIMQGDYHMTIRTYARAVLACGYEPRFDLAALVAPTDAEGKGHE